MCKLKIPHILQFIDWLCRMEQHAMSLAAMERITQEQLQNNLDEIFARVNRENIGFLILNDAGEEDTVLFPARWLENDELAS